MTTDIMELLAFATQAVKSLDSAGYTAYFAGGWVRDYLMDHPSDDVDIATDAPPEVILRLFPNTIHVGRAFGVYIVPYKGKQVEIAIFRRDVEYLHGRRPESIEPSTPEQDALRRDFTINGMFYDPIKEVVHDWVHGAEDITKKIIRTIGDPDERFYEDRLRMVRAVRFATRFAFNIDPETADAIIANADTLFPAVSMERIWQELTKMSQYPHFDHAIVELHRLQLLGEIFPELKMEHLNEIKKRVARFHEYPRKIPLVAYLIQLFPNKTASEMEELLRSMKVSVKEIRLALFLIESKLLLEGRREITPWQWAHFYAHPYSQLCLEIFSLEETWLKRHDEQRINLREHIERIQKKLSVVTSDHLKQQGIPPGIQMGELLRQAEKIAINENLHDPQEVIAKLRISL